MTLRWLVFAGIVVLAATGLSAIVRSHGYNDTVISAIFIIAANIWWFCWYDTEAE